MFVVVCTFCLFCLVCLDCLFGVWLGLFDLLLGGLCFTFSFDVLVFCVVICLIVLVLFVLIWLRFGLCLLFASCCYLLFVITFAWLWSVAVVCWFCGLVFGVWCLVVGCVSKVCVCGFYVVVGGFGVGCFCLRLFGWFVCSAYDLRFVCGVIWLVAVCW